MKRRVWHGLVILAGAVLLVWGVAMLTASSATCRGRTMEPGDTCHYASPSDARTERVQTYEERVATVRANAPVVIVLGMVTTIFGAVLLSQEIRATTAKDW